MLQRIRDNASGPIAYAIVGLITLVFGVWGIGSYFTPSANPVVASVGDAKITKYQLQQAYDQRYRRLRAMLGERFEPQMIEPSQLRRSTLQRLIRRAVLDQYALSAGYRTTDQALLAALKADPRFQVNGEFSTQRYRTLLANSGIQPAAFESRLRRDMVSNQVRAGVVNSAFVAQPGVEHAYRLQQQKRNITYLVFAASAYKDQVKIGDEEIAVWYDAHGEQYMRPQRVKLAYVELNRSALGAEQAVTQDKLHSLYADNKARFSTPDERDGRSIFIPVTSDNASAARQTVQTTAGKLAQGKTFSDIAQAMGERVQVEKLNNVTRADLSADVAQALFALEAGEVSSPIRTDKGWYILKTTAVQPGKTQPFTAVQQQLKKMAREQWRSRRFSELSERMEALAFQAPNSLKTLSQELDLKVQTTSWITRQQGDKLGQYKAVRQAAFSDAVLNKGLNSTVVQVGKGRQVVVRVAQQQPPQQIPLEQVKQDIRDQLVAKQAQQLAQAAAQKAREQLAAGKDMTAIAAKTPAQLQQPGYVGRTTTTVPKAVRTAAFGLAAADDGEQAYAVTQTAGGDTAVVAVKGIKMPQNGETQVPTRFARAQRGYVAQLEYAAFSQYLNAHADVEINRDQVEL